MHACVHVWTVLLLVVYESVEGKKGKKESRKKGKEEISKKERAKEGA